MFLLLCFFATFALFANGQTNKGIEIGFPESWDGDKFFKESCPSQGIPTWLNGYFLVQSCASYGKRSDPLGKKFIHMFDGFGAVSSIKLDNGNVEYSAKYYPTRGYKIWNFYDRDLSKSNVAWADFQRSPYNVASVEMWNHITGDNSFPISPSVDFWKIGQTVLGATEWVGVGMKFDVPSLTNFTAYPFKDTDSLFQHDTTRFSKGQSSMLPLMIPVHERVEEDGSLYAGMAAFDPTKNKMYQVIIHVATDGTRTIAGTFDHGTYDLSKCTSDGSYTGDKNVLAGYMHSITSTKKYIILPITSVIYNPCKLPPALSKLQLDDKLPEGLKQFVNFLEFADDVPIRFLIFDKMKKRFVTEQPIVAHAASFVTHQFNAYEDDDGTIIADMVGYEPGQDMNGYDVLLVENLLKEGGGFQESNLYRFRIDPKTKSIQHANVLADKERIFAEFPAYNRDFMEKKYKFGYIVEHPYKAGSKILKIDMDARQIVASFAAPESRSNNAVFKEPWFVAKPGGKDEDDGVILAVAGDIKTKTSTIYVLCGKTMKMIGQAEIPTFIPFGFHNRFYSYSDLGLKSNEETNTNQFCEGKGDKCST